MAVLVYAGIETGDWETMPVVLACCVGLAIYAFLLRRGMLSRFMQGAKRGDVVCRTGFTQTHIILWNETTGNRQCVQYEEIARWIEEDGAWLFMTKDRTFLPVFPNTLNNTDRKSLLQLLKSRCPKIISEG